MYDRVQLVKRGIAFAGDCKQKFAQHVSVTKSPEDAEKFLRELLEKFKSPGSIALLSVTLISFVFLLCSVEYAIRFVATNLAIVEHTEQSSGRIALSDEPDAPLYKAPLLEDFPEDQKLPIPEQQAALPIRPITAGLRSTIRHIHSMEGFRARFRGIKFALFYGLMFSMFSIIFQALFIGLIGPMGSWFGTTAAALVCCNAHATWTHATIAAPSEKTFFQRFLPRQVARQLVLPTLRLHATVGMMRFVVVTLGRVAVHKTRHSGRPHVTAHLGLLPIVVGLVMAFGIVLPSYIALIRTEASLLPEDMSAIVPFDRTFGGRFLQTEDETTTRRCAFVKKVTVRGAFMTFNKDTYKRTAKMLVKFGIVTIALNTVAIGVLLAEVFMIAGGSENIRKLAEILHAARRGEL
jgi:hypothetical protein